jgi:methylamine dehydrogenase accessory protein MauD
VSLILLVARVLLALVFVVAGLAKLADRAGARQALRDFGVPAALATPLGLLLPLAELAVAVALLPTRSAWWGALGALVLLLLFIAGIGASLARGRTPDCHCFGQLHSAPAGWSTLTRNAVLAAIAAFVVWQGHATPGPSAVGWLGALTAVQWVSLVVGLVVLGLLAAEGWILLQLVQQNGRLLVRLEAVEKHLGIDPTQGLPIGAPAPPFRLPSLDGERVTLDALRAPGKPVLLVFVDPGCAPCTALLPEIGRWQRDHAATLTLALISSGTPEANRAKMAEHAVTHVLLQRDAEVMRDYRVPATPNAVLVRPDGTIGSLVARGAEAIRELVVHTLLPSAPPLPAGANGRANGATGAPSIPAAPSIGEPAPPLALPDLTGTTVDLAALRGHPTLVLFWNPACGFCQQMLDDLKAWERRPPQGAPRLLVVSTGTVEANQAQGLRSRVVLDEGFAVARAFGATGTPMAVLVDGDGKVASAVVTGAQAVLALARSDQAQRVTAGT